MGRTSGGGASRAAVDARVDQFNPSRRLNASVRAHTPRCGMTRSGPCKSYQPLLRRSVRCRDARAAAAAVAAPRSTGGYMHRPNTPTWSHPQNSSAIFTSSTE